MGWEDDRGVSEVLGAILLFGILVTAVGGYQAFVVPHQNEQVEHRHDMQVNDEFPKIQAAISNAAGSGEPRTASLTLGTDYPFRVFSVGLSPTTGNIKTGEPGTVSVEGDLPDGFSLADTCGFDTDPETRSIQYRANYNEYDNAGRFVYENGVSYREVDGSVVVRNDQELVDGNTITLYPVTNGSFDRTSSASEQLRFRPGQTGVRRVMFEEEVTLSVPTELTEDQWEKVLDGEVNNASRINVTDGTLHLTLQKNQRYWIRCTPVGVNQQPSQDFAPPRDDQPSQNVGFEINPRDAVYLSTSNISGSTAEATFVNGNEAAEWNITEARIPFVLATGSPTSAVVNGNSDDVLEIGEGYGNITDVTIDSGSSHTMTLEFDDVLVTQSESQQGPQFDPLVIISLRLESGQTVRYQTYFVTDTS